MSFSGILHPRVGEQGHIVRDCPDPHEARTRLLRMAGLRQLDAQWRLCVWNTLTQEVAIEQEGARYDEQTAAPKAPRSEGPTARRIAGLLEEILEGGDWMLRAEVLAQLPQVAEPTLRAAAHRVGVEMERAHRLGWGGNESYWRLPGNGSNGHDRGARTERGPKGGG